MIRRRSTNVTVIEISTEVAPAGPIQVTSLEEGVRTVASLGSPKPEVAEPISGWLRETNSVLVKMHRSRWKFRHSPREVRKVELRRRRLNRRLRTKLQALSMTFDALQEKFRLKHVDLCRRIYRTSVPGCSTSHRSRNQTRKCMTATRMGSSVNPTDAMTDPIPLHSMNAGHLEETSDRKSESLWIWSAIGGASVPCAMLGCMVPGRGGPLKWNPSIVLPIGLEMC